MTNLSDEQVWAKINSVRPWYHKITIRPGIVTPGVNDCEQTLKTLQLPDDCRGKRVLDLGTRDGFFAFEMERRGAEVVAVDYCPKEDTGFHVVAELRESRVMYYHENIYNLTPEKFGTFDIVLFLGLLYHLADPMLSLRIVRSLCRDLLVLETHAIDKGVLLADGRTVPLAEIAPGLADLPIMQFYPGASLNNDPSNYWGPNMACLKAMLVENGFVVLDHCDQDRAIVRCKVNDREDDASVYFRTIERGVVGKRTE